MPNESIDKTPEALAEWLARQWDGCIYECPGETIDIGRDIRAAAAKWTARAVLDGAPAQEPVAWIHPDDGRILAADVVRDAHRQGGAALSAVAGYTIPLYAGSVPAQEPDVNSESWAQAERAAFETWAKQKWGEFGWPGEAWEVWQARAALASPSAPASPPADATHARPPAYDPHGPNLWRLWRNAVLSGGTQELSPGDWPADVRESSPPADAQAEAREADDYALLDWIARQDLDELRFAIPMDRPHDGEYEATWLPLHSFTPQVAYGKTLREALRAAMQAERGESERGA